jgi:hypothetical protein
MLVLKELLEESLEGAGKSGPRRGQLTAVVALGRRGDNKTKVKNEESISKVRTSGELWLGDTLWMAIALPYIPVRIYTA